MPAKQRLIAYVDGFNFYYGLREAGLHRHKWLNIHRMCESLLKPEQSLKLVRYFTSQVSGKAERRQSNYLEALTTVGGVEIEYGHFLKTAIRCYRCQNTWKKPEEKKTDVNISVRMLEDAYDDLFDIALLISGDSDLVPPVESIHKRYSDKKVIIAKPPCRRSEQLDQAAHGTFRISNATIRQNRLPDPVIRSDGRKLYAPSTWGGSDKALL